MTMNSKNTSHQVYHLDFPAVQHVTPTRTVDLPPIAAELHVEFESRSWDGTSAHTRNIVDLLDILYGHRVTSPEMLRFLLTAAGHATTESGPAQPSPPEQESRPTDIEALHPGGNQDEASVTAEYVESYPQETTGRQLVRIIRFAGTVQEVRFAQKKYFSNSSSGPDRQ